MAAELESEKAKTDMLLNEMLPARVVKQLQEGKRVDAGKSENNTTSSVRDIYKLMKLDFLH